MALDLATVIKQLTDSGIISPGKLENFIPPKADPKTPEELVQALIKSENLTAFQGQQVKGGKAKALILGEYTILDRIGAGGMGQVFKAQHRRMKRLVAVKMLPPAVTKDAAAVARFEREVEAAAKLRHPNIVAADDAGYANGAHFLVMEYVDGKDLSAMVKKDGPFPVNKAVSYILQAAKGLEFAHRKGVIHRDIKPGNLLLDNEGVVKILDMGLARIESDVGPAQTDLTGTGTIMGTVDYMSPEQALNTKDADQRADIYSLGCSLYFLLAGKAAYSGETAMQKLMAHQNQPIPSLQEAQTTVSKQLEAVFKKMVAKRIEDRYQSMSEIVEALERLGFGGSSTGGKGDLATTMDLSSADRKKLAAQAKKKPLSSLTDAVASEKTKHLVLKIIGGAFATIIAPIVVTYLIEYLRKEHTPPNPPAATGPAATVPPVVLATSSPPSPLAGEGPGVRGPQAWNAPAFQTWMKTVDAMRAEKQVEAVAKKLQELNPGFDGKLTPSIQNGVVVRLQFVADNVTDISPVQALTGLTSLTCSGGTSTPKGKLSDLSPLQRMKLTYLFCPDTQVSDLSPLSEMPLTVLNCGGTQVSDLSPLQGLPLIQLVCGSTQVSDLSPLKGMPLTALFCFDTQVSDLSPLQGMNLTHVAITPDKIAEGMDVIRQMKSLTAIAIGSKDKEKFPPDEFWKKYDTGEFGKPVDSAKLAYLDPAFQQWMKTVAAMPAEEQVKAVSKKLMELNPGFDGKVTGPAGTGTPTIENDVVVKLSFITDNAKDISPVRALAGLRVLNCAGTFAGKAVKSSLSDLSPLQGMPLSQLQFNATQVSDLSSLQGMQLSFLHCGSTQVADLSPLSGMPLTRVVCQHTPVSDLSPLQDCKSLTELLATETKVTSASVAVLQKALPNCKIEWDGAAKPVTNINDPAFQAWMKTVAALPAEKQVEAVSKKLMELNPGFDGKVTGLGGRPTPKIENGMVMELWFFTDNVTDISPVRALVGLKTLTCEGSVSGKWQLSDLSPLQGMALTSLICRRTNVSSLLPLAGMPLTSLYCNYTQVSDLSPLRGMPLTNLRCGETQVADLSPLEGMKLTELQCERTRVSDLSPLKKMKLTNLSCHSTSVSDLSPLQGMSTLAILDVRFTEVTPAAIAALQKALPNCKFGDPVTPFAPSTPITNINDPAFQQWMKSVAAMPAEQQIEAVSKKLMELNPGFDGKVTGLEGNDPPKIEKGMVTQIKFVADNVVDISPVRVLAGLKILRFGSPGRRSKLSDLSPLEGMKLTSLEFWGTEIVDLSPLRRMPLTSLNCSGTRVMDLSPLQGMPLTGLWLNDLPVFDISPLIDCKTLNTLTLLKTKVTAASVAALQKALPKCQITFDDPSKPATNQPWNTPAFQQWVKATQALPAEQQIEAVSKKLMELNPGFDGQVMGIHHSPTPKIENGVVNEFGLVTDKVTDISPVRALAGLKILKCVGDGPVKGRLSDLSPLTGMPLTGLWFNGTQVSDLSPLEGMNLTAIAFTPQNITKGLDVIRQMKSLKTIGLRGDRDKTPPKEFWKKYDAGEFGKPVAPSKLAYLDPAFQQWVTATQKLPAEQQIEAVSKKLMELNPGFDGKADPRIDNGIVTELKLITDKVTDISPVRALNGLDRLKCGGSGASKCQLSDLSPLNGLPLKKLLCYYTQVSDLSPLQECKSLKSLIVTNTKVTLAQVAALQKALPNCKIEWDGSAKLAYLDPAFQQWVKATQALPAEKQIEAVSKKLVELNPGFDGKLLHSNGKGSPKIVQGVVVEMGVITDHVTDLSPVRALAGLNVFICTGSEYNKGILSDLSPLASMRLQSLGFGWTQVSDLSPLRGMPLAVLNCGSTKVTDLSPLAECKNLRLLQAKVTQVTPAQVAALQKALPNCKIEWDDPAKPKTPEPAASGPK